jgi:hypothetical protein
MYLGFVPLKCKLRSKDTVVRSLLNYLLHNGMSHLKNGVLSSNISFGESE